MKQNLKRVNRLIPAAFALVFGMVVQTSPDQIASNVSKWKALLFSYPIWITSAIIDYQITLICFYFIILSLIWFFWPQIEQWSGRAKIFGLIIVSAIGILFTIFTIPNAPLETKLTEKQMQTVIAMLQVDEESEKEFIDIKCIVESNYCTQWRMIFNKAGWVFYESGTEITKTVEGTLLFSITETPGFRQIVKAFNTIEIFPRIEHGTIARNDIKKGQNILIIGLKESQKSALQMKGDSEVRDKKEKDFQTRSSPIFKASPFKDRAP